MIDHTKKIISTYGQSGGYGKPQKKMVEDILSSSFPDYELNITITNYIRG
jgi:hypothetical protein